MANYVSFDNLKVYDGKIKTYIGNADAVVQASVDAEVTRAKAAEEANADAAKKAQDEVDALELVVDTKAAQTDLDNLEAYVGEFTTTDTTVDTVVKYIDAKTANIASDTVVNAIGERLTQAEADIDAIEADYLKTADKTELQGNIDNVSTVANAAKTSIDAFLADADVTTDAVDTLKEIQAQLDSGEASAASMLAEINALKAVDNATQQELDDAVTTINNSISTKADTTTVNAIDTRVQAIEAIDIADKAYADQSEADAVTAAKTYADGLNTAMDTRVQALEGETHTHTNKAELDLIVTGDVAKWNASEQNAKDYADTLNTAMDTRVKALETGIANVYTKSETDTAIANAITQFETDSAVSDSDIEGLFA